MAIYVILALLLIAAVACYLQYGGDEDSSETIDIAVEDLSDATIELEDLELPSTAEPEANRGASETGSAADGSKPLRDANGASKESGQRRGILLTHTVPNLSFEERSLHMYGESSLSAQVTRRQTPAPQFLARKPLPKRPRAALLPKNRIL